MLLKVEEEEEEEVVAVAELLSVSEDVAADAEEEDSVEEP